LLNEKEQIETVTFQALAHPTRRTIIRIVQMRNQGVSYTELITELGLSTGKLNYHLEQLKGLIEKNSDHFYVLTPFGAKALEHLNSSNKGLVLKMRNTLKLRLFLRKQAFNQ
jgi:hypothetical protein